MLLWPGSYELAIEAIVDGRSKFMLELNSRVPAPMTQQGIGRSGRVGAGGKSFEVLAVPGVEVVTVGLTGLSADVDIRLFDAEDTEFGSSTNPNDADEEIVVHLWGAGTRWSSTDRDIPTIAWTWEGARRNSVACRSRLTDRSARAKSSPCGSRSTRPRR